MTYCSGSGIYKVVSLDQQHRHHLGTWQKCKFLNPDPRATKPVTTLGMEPSNLLLTGSQVILMTSTLWEPLLLVIPILIKIEHVIVLSGTWKKFCLSLNKITPPKMQDSNIDTDTQLIFSPKYKSLFRHRQKNYKIHPRISQKTHFSFDSHGFVINNLSAIKQAISYPFHKYSSFVTEITYLQVDF